MEALQKSIDELAEACRLQTRTFDAMHEAATKTEQRLDRRLDDVQDRLDTLRRELGAMRDIVAKRVADPLPAPLFESVEA